MVHKSKCFTGREVKLQKEIDADGRDQRELPPDNQLTDNLKAFDLEVYERQIRRALGDVAVLIHDWPCRIRYSYFVGSNGKLLSRAERRNGK